MDRTDAARVCAFRDAVADLLGATRFRTWFGDSVRFEVGEGQVDVFVAQKFAQDWIARNYMNQLVEAAKRILGGAPLISIHVVDASPTLATAAGHAGGNGATTSTAPERPAGPLARRQARQQLRGELESFVVGPSNELAYSVAAAFVRAPGQAFKHLVLYGGCGLGKTHLVQAICNGVHRHWPEFDCLLVPCEEFTNDFVQAVRATTVDQFRARYRDVDVLVLDDVHFLINKKATQEEFLNTYNAIDAAGKMVVLTCDRHPRSLQALPEPLINRLIAAMTVEIGPPDYTVRREILRRRAASMQCELPEAVLDFLAARVVRNVRELEGALYKLAAVASLTREKLTLELVRRTVEDYMPAARAPEPPEFVRQCALYFGLTVDSLGSDSRDRTVTLARGLAMFLLRRHTKLSYPEIGRLLGHKQHSTAIMAVRRIQHQLDHDAAVTWRTAGGARDAPVRCLLDELEQRLLQ